MARLIEPYMTYNDANGTPLNGGKLKFLVAETASTLKDTFSDDDLTTPNTNPIVLDSAGRANIDVFGTGDYKLVVLNSADVVQETFDHLLGGGLQSTATYVTLKALDVAPFTDGDTIYVEGGAAVGDGGQGHFRITSSTPGDDNGGTILHSDTSGWFFERQIDDDIKILWFVPNADGTTDDAAIFRSAVADAKTRTRRLTVPYGKYLFNSTDTGNPTTGIGLDLYQVEMVGEGLVSSGQFNTGEYPALIQGANVQDFIRLGQPTDIAGGRAGTRFENFVIDGSLAPEIALPTQGARGVFCKFGLNNFIMRNITTRANRTADWVAANLPTVTEAKTSNWTGYDLHLNTSANSGLYYNVIDNITAVNAYRGIWIDGDSSDGLRVSTLGLLRVAGCVQGITIAEAEVNTFSLLAVTGFLAAYDPTGTHPANIDQPAAGEQDEWGIMMPRGQNTILQTYIEGTPTSPIIFTGEDNVWLNVRNADGDPDRIQIIFGDVKVTSSTPGGTAGHHVLAGKELEVSSIAGPQTQTNLIPDADFRSWDGDATSVSDGDAVAGSVKAAKSGTGRLDIAEDTTTVAQVRTRGRTAMLTLNGSASAVETDKIYGLKVAMSAHFPLTGTALRDITTMHRQMTVVCWVRPPAGVKTVFKLTVDDGVTTKTTTRNMDDNYDDASPTTNDDSPIKGPAGTHHVVVVQFDYDSTGDITITAGVQPQATNEDRVFYIDNIYAIAGEHGEYARPLVVPASIPIVSNHIAASADATPDGQFRIVTAAGVTHYVQSKSTPYS